MKGTTIPSSIFEVLLGEFPMPLELKPFSGRNQLFAAKIFLLAPNCVRHRRHASVRVPSVDA
jgi:hypothetical protein